MNKIPIFLAFDNRISEYYKHVFNSIRANSTIDFEPHIILESNENSISEFEGIIVHKVKPDVTHFFQGGGVQSKAMYFRWMIPDLTESDTAIYLDNDVIVLGDIKELADIDFGNYLVGAVPNYFQKTVAQTQFFQGRCPIGLDNKAYLSGQLVINCKMWRQNNIRESLRLFVKKYNVLDEAALNIVCQKRIIELSKYWCVNANRIDDSYQHKSLLYEYDFEKTKLLHYAGKQKPWNSKLTRNYKFYEKYL